MVAQAVTGTPGHINSLAARRPAILDEYPTDSLDPGDVLITNDPYKTAGQLLDVTVLVPVFGATGRSSRFFGSTIHHTDVGGYGIGAGGARRVRRGPVDPDLQAARARASATRTCGSSSCPTCASPTTWRATSTPRSPPARSARSGCGCCATPTVSTTSRTWPTRSSGAVGGRHPGGDPRSCPRGTYNGSATLDLADGSSIEIKRGASRSTRRRARSLVDYEGSSGASPYGINVVKNYTHAYTTFTVRSVLNPEVPNNHGSLAPIKVEAPEGSIVNAVSPAPCTARHVVGMFLPNALLKALAQLKPEQAMAEGSGAVWTMQVLGQPRRRPPVHHGDVHLRRRRRGPRHEAGPQRHVVSRPAWRPCPSRWSRRRPL